MFARRIQSLREIEIFWQRTGYAAPTGLERFLVCDSTKMPRLQRREKRVRRQDFCSPQWM